jgi:uncharacterized protein (TIGR00255 family)
MKSMTGFGSAEQAGPRGSLSVEVRSYNHRFLDLRLRVSRPLQSLEPKIYLWARNRLARGRVEMLVKLEEGEAGFPLEFNPFALRFYLDLEKRLSQEFGVPGKLDMAAVLQLREVVSGQEEAAGREDIWPGVLATLEAAVVRLEEMQTREGSVLQADLLERFRFLSEQLRAVESLTREAPGQFRQKLEERIARLLPPESADPQRLAQEVVLYADRIDVTEEIVRLGSHLEVCRQGVGDGSMGGKRLDFMAQEIHRELNTIGSKSPHSEIVQRIVGMKTELEKIREQIQNIQ